MRTCDFVDRGLFTQVWQSQLARKISQPDQNPSRWVLRGTCSRPPKYRRCPIRGKIGQLILCTNEKRSASKQVCSQFFDVHAPNVSLFFWNLMKRVFLIGRAQTIAEANENTNLSTVSVTFFSKIEQTLWIPVTTLRAPSSFQTSKFSSKSTIWWNRIGPGNFDFL